MPMQTFALTPGRINKFKGRDPCARRTARSVGQNRPPSPDAEEQSATPTLRRRWLPYGATATSASTQNEFFQNATGDRGNVIVQAHQIQEGVTPAPDSIVPLDITVVLQQFGCLYGFTDKTYDLYEDDIPKAMIEQIGERVTFVNEMIIYGALRACTNAYYGGAGTSVATVNGGLTLGMVRKIAKNLQANHGKPVNKVLRAGPNFATDAVAEGYTVYCHTDLEPDIRDLPNFVPAESYASGTPMPNEIGKCERFRFITSPDLPSIQDGGAAVGSTGLYSTRHRQYRRVSVHRHGAGCVGTDRGTWQGQLCRRRSCRLARSPRAIRLASVAMPATSWWKAVMIENQGWMAVGFVGSKVLV